MQPFRVHTGIVAPLDRADVDTDQIIPKQFLKRVERTGFGEFLFYDWRASAESATKSDFVLNDRRYESASILVAGRNFGCGSSREHAVWALVDYGFRAIIAPNFADIFSNNSGKNGLALVVLQPAQVDELLRRAQQHHAYKITVDLENNLVSDAHGFSAPFRMDSETRERLLNGLDDIALTLQHEEDIRRYEATHATLR